MEIIALGREPLRELIGAMHSKLLLAELQSARSERGLLRAARRRPLPLDGAHGRPVGRPQSSTPARRPRCSAARWSAASRARTSARARDVRDPRTGTCGEVEVAARVVARPGRSVELLEAELTRGGRPVMTARAWRVLRSPAPAVGRRRAAAAARTKRPRRRRARRFGYGHAVELRFARRRLVRARAGDRVDAPARRRRGRTRSRPALQRVLAVADSGNGISAVLPLDEWLFINPELSVHLRREPRGEWICLDAATTIADGRRRAWRARCSATTTASSPRARSRCSSPPDSDR